MENENELQELSVKEGKKLNLVNTLKETTRIVGELKVNGKMFNKDDEKLSKILVKTAADLDEFNKELMKYLIEA